MALLVETGEGVEGADAYESEADTVIRLTSRGLVRLRGLSPVQREEIIRSETSQVDAFLQAFQTGRRENLDQGLLFPRIDSFFSDRRPIERKNVPEDLKLGMALRCEKSADRKNCNGEERTEVDSFRVSSGLGYVHLKRFIDVGP